MNAEQLKAFVNDDKNIYKCVNIPCYYDKFTSESRGYIANSMENPYSSTRNFFTKLGEYLCKKIFNNKYEIVWWPNVLTLIYYLCGIPDSAEIKCFCGNTDALKDATIYTFGMLDIVYDNDSLPFAVNCCYSETLSNIPTVCYDVCFIPYINYCLNCKFNVTNNIEQDYQQVDETYEMPNHHQYNHYLICCYNCDDCSDCNRCIDCKNCHNCVNSKNCKNCEMSLM